MLTATLNRLNLESPAPKTRKPKGGKPAPASLPKADAVALRRWATAGVWLTLGLSGLLNGYANAQHSPISAVGWALGLATPALVLILSKVASLLIRRKRTKIAGFAASTGAGLLALSVYHCATAVALLTGTPLALAVPMAIAIDCGLVACELATVAELK